MNQPQFYSVITTIQPPTPAVRALARALGPLHGRLLVAGDRKGPRTYRVARAELISFEQQKRLQFDLPRLLPANHYVRKNAGYLVAISQRASCIYETDDDNEPLPGWRMRERMVQARLVGGSGWCNVYRHFSPELIWPRGLPLDQIQLADGRRRAIPGRAVEVNSPIQQGLANLSPDVDAVWRLVFGQPIQFRNRPSLALQPGVWCPFNSQSTWWWPEAYPLLYLPSFCTFRMTDIWRSFVAQRCLWAAGGRLVFHAPEVLQRRNQHNLQRDFEDEIPGYVGNAKIVAALEGLRLEAGPSAVAENLVRCYETLVHNRFLPAKELPLVRAWVRDLEKIEFQS